jgi:hypothetical protein
MLAMAVNDNAGSLVPRGVLRFFASVLAPTGTDKGTVRYPAVVTAGARAGSGP